MTNSISSATNKDENGVYGWEKSVVDVNDIDEGFANARDLGYTRLNYARVSTIAEIGKYNSVDTYKIQLQSNSKLSISLRSGGGDDDKVLDLSKYEEYLENLKQQQNPTEFLDNQLKEKEAEANKGILDDTAPGMRIKVYMVKNNKTVLIGDSTADKDSKEFQAIKEILTGEYRAKKGNYYIEVGLTEDADKDEAYPYAMQIMQGTNFKHDYVMKQTASADTKNKEISTKPDANLSTSTGTATISAAYAAQIQAVSGQSAANMLAAGYLNIASLNADDSNSANAIFSNLLY